MLKRIFSLITFILCFFAKFSITKRLLLDEFFIKNILTINDGFVLISDVQVCKP